MLCRSACSPCSSSVGGWLQIAGLWDAVRRLARRRSARAARRAERPQDYCRERASRSALGLVGIGVAWFVLRAPAAAGPAHAPPSSTRSSTSSTSTSSTTWSSTGRPSALAVTLRRVRRGAADRRLDRGRSRRRARARAAPSARVQTGSCAPTRSCSPAPRRRPRRRLRRGAMTTALILLPLAAALVVWLLPLPGRATAALALLVAARRGRLWIVARRALRLRRGGLQLDDRHAGSATSASPTTSASTASRSGSSG